MPSNHFSSTATLADLLKIAVETAVSHSSITHSEHPDPALISAVARNWRGSYHDKVDIIQALAQLANNGRLFNETEPPKKGTHSIF